MVSIVMNETWAREQLEQFLKLAQLHPVRPGELYNGTVGDEVAIQRQAAAVDLILDRVQPDWRNAKKYTNADHWDEHREACTRALALLERSEEINENLGEDAPHLDASHLHPWVWEGARSLWQSGHFGEAVRAASRKVNAEVQNKLGRRDIGETELLQLAFSPNPPKPGEVRLRLSADDGSKTFKSRHAGAGAFGHGCYGALRNPGSHEVQGEMAEDEALEQLAAFSILARWIDTADVVR
jgi:hypothetical protein